jgi:hypothetical protein
MESNLLIAGAAMNFDFSYGSSRGRRRHLVSLTSAAICSTPASNPLAHPSMTPQR